MSGDIKTEDYIADLEAEIARLRDEAGKTDKELRYLRKTALAQDQSRLIAAAEELAEAVEAAKIHGAYLPSYLAESLAKFREAKGGSDGEG